MISKSSLLAERLKRQALLQPIETHEDYIDLVRRLQPITPIANTRPGEPPRLVHRCAFDDGVSANRLRASQGLVKGRFAGGTVGYVLRSDFGLYANTFCRPMGGMNRVQSTVLDVVQRLGPVTSRQVKEETGLLSKQIGPALQRLQQAFLVFEEQADNDWERPWYPMHQIFPDVTISEALWEESARVVVRRFVEAMVFATTEQICVWTQLARARVSALVGGMKARGELTVAESTDYGAGWVSAGDKWDKAFMPESVFMLHKADFLVRAH